MTSGNASYFVDANVLVYAALKDDSRHEVSKALLKDTGRGALHLSPQILAEFYSTVTNPKRVTVPYSPPEAIEFIETLLSYEHGPQVFDLQIAATMLTNGLTKLFTYNGADFKGVNEIQTSEPEMPSVTP